MVLAVVEILCVNVVELATKCGMQSNPVWLIFLRANIRCLNCASQRCKFSFRATYAILFRAYLLWGHRVETLIRESRVYQLDLQGFVPIIFHVLPIWSTKCKKLLMNTNTNTLCCVALAYHIDGSGNLIFECGGVGHHRMRHALEPCMVKVPPCKNYVLKMLLAFC